MTITHMTLTGPNAGVPLCGAVRDSRDDYTHAIYCDENDDSICKACLNVWNDSEDCYEYHIDATFFGYRAWVTCNGSITRTDHFADADYDGGDGSYAAAQAFLRENGSPE